MELRTIVNRPINLPVHEEEMKYVVVKYIVHKKAKAVNIDLQKGDILRPFGRINPIMYTSQIGKLVQAFAVACAFYKENPKYYAI